MNAPFDSSKLIESPMYYLLLILIDFRSILYDAERGYHGPGHEIREALGKLFSDHANLSELITV